MPSLPALRGNEVVAAFEKAGFYVHRINGSHRIMKRDDCPNRLSIPVHAGETVGKGLLKSQIRAAGMSVEDFLDLL